MPISYYQMINNVKVKFNFRYHLVEYAKTHSIAEAAREFQTTRKTIRKWLGRYRTHSLKGLEDKSKRNVQCYNHWSSKRDYYHCKS